MDNRITIKLLCAVLAVAGVAGVAGVDQPPEGYYAFVESPNAVPPKVKPPPYTYSKQICPMGKKSLANNLCGDLNKGFIPQNPIGQNILGYAYPFDLIKNKTLEFFSKTLPILKADDTLPKVAQYIQEPGDPQPQNTASPKPQVQERHKRQLATRNTQESRKFCDNGGGMLCMLYKALNGESLKSGLAERRDDNAADLKELPPTPCPAKVDYATPVFARNHQGVWRYVVQIPYEGYFTQTIEVTTCLQSRCHYMDGGCLSSPRWTSLLVAEIFYPDTVLPMPATNTRWRDPISADNPPPVHDFQNYQQYLHKRAGVPPATGKQDTKKTSNCDGVDEIGCFQVRLYYDWFLVPGSCKCWRPDYFNRYIRRKNVSPDL